MGRRAVARNCGPHFNCADVPRRPSGCLYIPKTTSNVQGRGEVPREKWRVPVQPAPRVVASLQARDAVLDGLTIPSSWCSCRAPSVPARRCCTRRTSPGSRVHGVRRSRSNGRDTHDAAAPTTNGHLPGCANATSSPRRDSRDAQVADHVHGLGYMTITTDSGATESASLTTNESIGT